MTSRSELDAMDRKILRILGGDGRASYQAIADEVGLSRPAIMERVKRLEESGHIAGYYARVDRARAGFPVTAFVAVRYAQFRHVRGEPPVRGLGKHPGVAGGPPVAGADCYNLQRSGEPTSGIQS